MVNHAAEQRLVTEASITDPNSIAGGKIVSAIQAALAKQRYTYRWADATERSAQAGMRAGDLGYQIDNDTVWKYSGTGWVVWERTAAYTPTITGVSLGNGTVDAKYSIHGGDLLTIKMNIYFGSTSTAGNPTITTPAGITYGPGISQIGIGDVVFRDVSANFFTRGVVRPVTGGFTLDYIYISGTSVRTTNMALDAPFAFATGDTIYISTSFRIENSITS